MMRTAAAWTANLLITAAIAGFPQTADAQGPADLAGGWIVTSWTSADGVTNAQPQRGLFVFAQAGQYSMMYVLGDAPRPTYAGESMTDAEMLAAYRSLVANSGRYTVEGNVITYDAYVAKDPNYMAAWNTETRENANRMRYSIRDGTLTLEWLDGFNEGMKATLRRPGQPQG